MNKELAKIEALLPDFQYVDTDHDRTILTVGFTASFHFWGGHTASKRAALVDCFEAFEAAFGEHLVWAMDADRALWVKLSDKKTPPLRAYVASLDEDDCIEWYLSSGEDHEAVCDYVVSCLTERAWMSGQSSYFQFHVPRALIFEIESQKKLYDLILFCHERLAPFHGNAGLSAVSTFDETKWEAEKIDQATRYLTLYIDDRVIDSMQAPHGIKDINWLTFVSNTLSEKLGGPVAFANYCQRFGVDVVPHAAGFIVRAGDLPQLGPVEEPMPEPYVKVNAAVRPLRNGNFGSMGTGSINGEVRFNRCTSDLWMRRFDTPGTWPPKSLIGLPRMPLGAAPVKRVKLRTGEICVLHGRYRDSSFAPDEEEYDVAPRVVLLPGDMAPYKLKLGPHGEFLGRETVTWQLVAEL